MKLELIEINNADGHRYQVRKDGSLQESFYWKDGQQEVALSMAKEYFERLKVPVEETIILSETI
jgi:hypothetical protein